jgi:murein DD-endopeptidase MepM/ murein hydrolase activator NlpD
MPAAKRALRSPIAIAALTGALLLGAAAPAAAGAPRIADVDCIRSCADGGQPRGGSLLLVRGSAFDLVSTAWFFGGDGRKDDRRGRVGRPDGDELRVRVPWEAEPGDLALGTRDGLLSRSVRVRLARVPIVSRYRCLRSCAARKRVRQGSLVLVKGLRLRGVTGVTFKGGVRIADDRPTPRVSAQRYRSFRVRVPSGASTGPFAAVEGDGEASPDRRMKIAPSATFPVRGRHDYGSSGSGFGAGRDGHSHQGQDVFARCGTRLMAVRGGKVRYAGYHSAAGNYIVVDGSRPNWDYVYMHLRRRPLYRTGQRVAAGARIGEVGETGNASGCHLHFELWSAPGWYEGGEPFDPLPYLRAWERTS